MFFRKPPGPGPGFELLGTSLVQILLIEFLLENQTPLVEGGLRDGPNFNPHELLQVGTPVEHFPYVDAAEPISVQSPVIQLTPPICAAVRR